MALYIVHAVVNDFSPVSIVPRCDIFRAIVDEQFVELCA